MSRATEAVLKLYFYKDFLQFVGDVHLWATPKKLTKKLKFSLKKYLKHKFTKFWMNLSTQIETKQANTSTPQAIFFFFFSIFVQYCVTKTLMVLFFSLHGFNHLDSEPGKIKWKFRFQLGVVPKWRHAIFHISPPYLFAF